MSLTYHKEIKANILLVFFLYLFTKKIENKIMGDSNTEGVEMKFFQNTYQDFITCLKRL